MRRFLASAAAATLLALSAPAYAAGTLQIERVDVSKWPNVKVEATSSTPSGLKVFENGTEIQDPKIKTFSESGIDMQVMLVIDTSGSMLGEPMAAALTAARRFVTTIPDEVEVGIVRFSDDAHLISAPTTDHSLIHKAITRLTADGETALYDGVTEGARAFGKADQKNIVLLSDGGDTVSDATLKASLGIAKKSGATIFAVGLESGEMDVPALRALASGTDGRYSSAGITDLSGMFEGIATELKNQFVISYRSEAESGAEFSVELQAGSLSDDAIALAPKVDQPVAAPRIEPADPLLEGTTGLAIVMGLTFLAIALTTYMLMGSSSRRKRDKDLQRLMTANSTDAKKERQEDGAVSWIPDSLVGVADQVVESRNWTSGLERKLERAGLSIRPGEFLALSAVTAVVGTLAGASTLGLAFMILGGAVGAAGPHLWVTFRGNRRFSALEAQIPDVLMVLASSLRAGHSFMQALDSVAGELADPGGQEFARVVAEIRLGRSVKEAMDDLADRIDSEDFRWALLAVNIQRDIGGNLAEILDTVAETIRGREHVRRQVEVLSAEGKLSMYILGSLPLFVGGWLFLVNREYINLLVGTRMGNVMLVGAAAMMAVGFVWMRKVVKIDV